MAAGTLRRRFGEHSGTCWRVAGADCEGWIAQYQYCRRALVVGASGVGLTRLLARADPDATLSTRGPRAQRLLHQPSSVERSPPTLPFWLQKRTGERVLRAAS